MTLVYMFSSLTVYDAVS